MSRGIRLSTGDLLLGNWMTVLGRLSHHSGQRYGHIAFVVVIDEVPHAYEISHEGKNPSIIPMREYLNSPTLIELDVRQLKVPLNTIQEEAFKQTLLKYRETTYPSLGKVLARVSSGQVKSKRRNELICSELVYSVLESMEWVPELRAVAGERSVLPDMFLPGVMVSIDRLYIPELRDLYKRKYTRAEATRILKPQLNQVGQLLLS